MFSTRRKFPTSFCIVSCIFTLLSVDGRPTTMTIKDRVKKEINGLTEILNEMDPGDKRELITRLDMWINRALEAEKTVQDLIAENVVLIPYKTLCVVRTRMEQLEKELYPRDQLFSRNRYDRWMVILNSKHYHAQYIRKRVEEVYGFVDTKKSHHYFATAMQKIYGDLNLAAYSPHNVIDNRILENIRRNPEEARDLFSMIGIPYENRSLNALKIIAEPIELPGEEVADFTYPTVDDMRYVVIRPTFGQIRTSTIKDTDISQFFGGKSIISIDIKPVQIIVEFEDFTAALQATQLCPVTLKGALVHVELSGKPQSSTFPPK